MNTLEKHYELRKINRPATARNSLYGLYFILAFLGFLMTIGYIRNARINNLPAQTTFSSEFSIGLKKVALLSDLTPEQQQTLNSLARDYTNGKYVTEFPALGTKVAQLAINIHKDSVAAHVEESAADMHEFSVWMRVSQELNDFTN